VLEDYLARKKIRSVKTAKTYRSCLNQWTRVVGAASPDELVLQIKNGQLDPYSSLQSYINHMNEKHNAPKTIATCYAACKGFLLAEDVELSENKLKNKITLPRVFTVSTDRAPSQDEMRRMLDYATASPATKVAILMLATSGVRISELTSLRIRDIELDRPEGSVKVTVQPAVTKGKKRRVTFITAESASLLREYLGERIDNLDERVFRINSDALYSRIMRTIRRAELMTKSEPNSKRYDLHPHSLRKFFFSNLLAGGIDRGIVEGFMGHEFALDSAYLRLTDDQLRELYDKAGDSMNFLTGADSSLRTRVENLEKENEELRVKVEWMDKALLSFVNDAASAKPLDPDKSEKPKRKSPAKSNQPQ
jgi:integrase